MHFLPQLIAWLIALGWMWRTFDAVRGMPTIPDLLRSANDLEPMGDPTITVIVPARNEAETVRAGLESLLAQDYPYLKIIAVDDRSTDQTGPILDSLACDRLRVLHIAALPPDWLGKTHAMAQAAALADSEYLLFTDADVLYRPDAIRRALAYAVVSRADHLVLAPTTIIRRWDEAAMLSFFQVFGMWAARIWKVADPRATRDAIGIGAFNLLRTDAYLRTGGFAALRMEIVEDLGIARRIKRVGLKQRFVFGRGLVRIHWASGVNGIVNVMTKNMFSAFQFDIWRLLVGCLWLVFFCILPFIEVWSRAFTIPAALTIGAICVAFRLMSPSSGLSAWNALLSPFAAALFIYTLLRSMVATLRQGGVIWRGTFYPLAELRNRQRRLDREP